MKALTIWQPWASLILTGAKPHEYRRWPAPRAMWGERIVIHAGVRRPKRGEIEDILHRVETEPKLTGLDAEIASSRLRRLLDGREDLLPYGAGLGTAVLGEPVKAIDLHGREVADSDRIDHSVWAWPLADIVPFETPVECRGAQGFWHWPQGGGAECGEGRL